jgi:CheY-like chemotaxis protein
VINYSLSTLKGSTILLVEDNTTNQEIILGLMEESGIVIDIASDGQEAVTKSKANQYELILMDLQMPIMDGYEATKIIRKTDKDIPIIALTANAMEEDIAKTKFVGMNEHLNKPIDIEQLFGTLLKYISPKVDPKELKNQNDADDANEKIISFSQAIDSTLGLQYMAGNQKLYQKVLHNFYMSYKDINLALFDDEKLKRTTHTIKGLSENIGASSLHEITKKLDTTQDKTLFDSWNREMKKVIEEIEGMIIKVQKEQKEEIKELKEHLCDNEKEHLFSSLKEAVSKRKPKVCTTILEEIASYKMEKNEKEMIEKLKDAIDEFNFDKAKLILSDRFI